MLKKYVSIFILLSCACAPAQRVKTGLPPPAVETVKAEEVKAAEIAPAQEPASAETVDVSSATAASVSPGIESNSTISLVNWGSLNPARYAESAGKPGPDADKPGRSEAEIRQMLNSPERDERAEAVLELGGMGDKRNIDEIAALMLNDPDYKVRADAAAALSLLDDAKSAEYLKKALKDPVEGVRASVVRALGEYPDKESVAAVVKVFSTASIDLCPVVVYALCRSDLGKTELFSIMRSNDSDLKMKILKTRSYCDGMLPVAEEIAAKSDPDSDLAAEAGAYVIDIGQDEGIGD
jgi:hypothetical protein